MFDFKNVVKRNAIKIIYWRKLTVFLRKLYSIFKKKLLISLIELEINRT